MNLLGSRDDFGRPYNEARDRIISHRALARAWGTFKSWQGMHALGRIRISAVTTGVGNPWGGVEPRVDRLGAARGLARFCKIWV